MNAKGFIGVIVFILLTIIIASGLVFIWNLKAQLDAIQYSVATPVPKPADPTKDWKTYKNQKLGISIKYPNGWNENDDGSISQYRSTNIISMQRQTGTLYPGYFAQDLFNILYFKKDNDSFEPEFFNNIHYKLIKLVSGKVASGNRYLVYKVEFNTENQVQELKAMVLDGDEVIVLVLANFDDLGLEIFYKMLPTASVIKLQPS